jgi:hypothetical protein
MSCPVQPLSGMAGLRLLVFPRYGAPAGKFPAGALGGFG